MERRKRSLAMATATLGFTLALAGLGVAASTGPAAFADEADDTETAAGIEVGVNDDAATVDTEGAGAATDTMEGLHVADFTDRSTGDYPDIQKNAEYQNSGNRGCNSCHDDLFTVDKDNGTYTHITTYGGLKKGNIVADCLVCHHSATGTAGNVMAENIHVAHYSSDAFLAANGNCWSCHTMTQDEDGNLQMMLYEELQYEAAYGGYPDNGYNEVTIQWDKDRGFDTGYLSGVTAVSDDDLQSSIGVTMDQAPSAEEDQFIILNYDKIDEPDGYDIDVENWTFEVTGVKNPRSFTLDELKGLPSVDVTSAQWCFVGGINSAMADNLPLTGVLLSDLIDACGGLEDGANTFYTTASDGWTGAMYGSSIQSYIDSGAMIVYGNYGHDLTIEQGGPAKLYVPGTGGSLNVKNLVGIDFTYSEDPLTFEEDGITMADYGIHVNTSWFDNDGVQAKVGEPVALEGASYGWATAGYQSYPTQIQFSFDYGKTWVACDVPEDFDPDQWVHYTIKWTPQEAGTYIVKAKAVTADGEEQPVPSSLIVVVSE